MSANEINVDRLIRVRDLVAASPELLNLSEDFVNGVRDASGALIGHSFCIGGLAALDAGAITLRSTPRPGTAAVLYDVLPIAERQYREDGALDMFRAFVGGDADRLMFVANWPKGFQKQLDACSTAEQRAKVTARRIDFFISNGGRE